jgi:molybdopterin synthase catalytic subunit
MREYPIVTHDPIDPEALIALVSDRMYGAVAIFFGLVRSPNKRQAVLHIDYEGYDAMIETQMRAIVEELRTHFEIGRVAIAHRLGRLRPGEVSVAIAISSRHRKEALAACQEGIDRIKERLPIWKYEVTEEGAGWVPGISVASESF